MEDLLQFVFDHVNKDILQDVAVYVLAMRAFFKPFCSFWAKFISPYISVRPTQKMLSNPVYKAAIYLLDWSSSIKLPKEQK